ncbi:MAG: hypothetical protein NTZ27_12840 [Ignavibacteriales bacterium]|nr:hypothetical protein [Ignavibacteriales bacterium]
MNKLTDEILNKYIDGELESFELAEVKNEIEKNDEVLARLKALRLVDNSLKQMEIEYAPVNFSEKVMKAIFNASKAVKPKISYFFVTIITLFSVAVLGVIVAAFKSIDDGNGPSTMSPYMDKAKEVIGKNLTAFHTFFSNQNVLLVVSILTLILLITVYLTFESHKNFKNKLNSYSR